MALANYSDLNTAVIEWAFRTGDSEFTARVPDFIRMAEDTVNYGFEAPAFGVRIKPLRSREMETTATLNLVDGAASLPADYLEFRAVNTNSDPNLDMQIVAPSGATAAYPGNTGSWPSNIRIIGSTITLVPGATSTTALNFVYYAKVPALTVSNTTNWLLTKAPTTYIYGCLFHAALYMQEDGRIQANANMFAGALNAVRSSDIVGRQPRSIQRSREYRP